MEESDVPQIAFDNITLKFDEAYPAIVINDDVYLYLTEYQLLWLEQACAQARFIRHKNQMQPTITKATSTEAQCAPAPEQG